MRYLKGFLIALVVLSSGLAFAQTGKITGKATDSETGEALPGVNVILVGTNLGAATDEDGNYTILNVPPGQYTVQASFIGYAQTQVSNVEVNIDLTTRVDFQLQQQAIAGQEVVVEAQTRVVKADISASRVDVSAQDVQNLPVTNIADIIGLQAGVQGMRIRGSGADQVDFMVDGVSLSSKRTNTPFTGVSYTAVQQVQVQAGGFNAEYGDMRSGVVNLVTKEGSTTKYSGELLARYSPVAQKHFGLSPNDPNSYWMKPYMDPGVAFVGTQNGTWDAYTQKQYPEFDGFNYISQKTLDNDNPNDNLTPEGAQQLFLFEHRRNVEVNQPDYTIDGSLSGPVPFLSEPLGNLRFLLSYRNEQNAYIVPYSRRAYYDYSGMLKVTSDLTSNMKLTFEQLLGAQYGSNTSGGRGANSWTTINQNGDREAARNYNGNFSVGYGQDAIFVPGTYSRGDILHNSTSLKLTHSLSSKTFYEIRAQRYRSDYSSYPIASRDTATVQIFPSNYHADESPMGFSYLPHNSLTGMRMGAHHSEFRDTSYVTQYNLQFDISSQMNQTNLVKSGLQMRIADQHINVGHQDFLLNPDDIYDRWNRAPLYLAGYLQDKMEFQGMIANVGLRLDYYNPRVKWFDYQNPWTDAFMGKNADQTAQILGTKQVKPELAVSPRLGISFPVTSVSKLYFNYGYFRQSLQPEFYYMVHRMRLTNQVTYLGDPTAPFPSTVAYELGYEQGIMNQFMLRIAGYYKALNDQPRQTHYVNETGLVDYYVWLPNDYQDVRGFEISLFKNVGRYVRGFINYNYMATKYGQFGFGTHYQNAVEQVQYETYYRNYQDKPLPQPFARFSLEFLLPRTFGPTVAGMHPLGNWDINILGRWQAGNYFTWTGRESVPGVRNNMQWPTYKMVDLRLSKQVPLSSQGAGSAVTLYVDVNNIFNIKNFNTSSFIGPEDYNNYMESLHLPKDVASSIAGYNNDYGTDKPGDINKDYIDPPNYKAFRYLFPRDIFFGVRFSF